MITRRLAALALAVPALGAAALAGTSHAATTPTATVATATAQNFRVDVTAERTSSGAAPSATVHVTAYTRSGNRWQPRGELRLGARNGFFFKTLTGPHAVRNFTISDDEPDRGSVQLLVSPALGWSPTYHFQLEHGSLVR